MTNLFFELIRVSIGTSTSLSRTPTASEWDELYRMAVKQSVIGVCFAGIRQLYASDVVNHMGMLPRQYFAWMGMAAEIQERNSVADVQCARLYRMLSADGYTSCILKGQGIASLYGEHLSALRQPGDIDIWVVATPNNVIEWARATGAMYYYDYHHADLSLFPDTEIELHYRPSLSRNLVRNARLQKWFYEEGVKHMVYSKSLGYEVPDYIFNVLLTMNHNFWHLLYEGVGLRQMMDLYFVMKSLDNTDTFTVSAQAPTENIKVEAWQILKYLKLARFSSASMWIMKELLYLEDKYLLCEPNEKLGRHLLEEIVQSGNFGKYDKRLVHGRYDNSRTKLMWVWMKHASRLFWDYPADVLWSPLGILRISLWRRFHYRHEKELRNQ